MRKAGRFYTFQCISFTKQLGDAYSAFFQGSYCRQEMPGRPTLAAA